MLCIRCNGSNTKCIDDMLQIHFVAEIYKCNVCESTIEVVYKDGNISQDNIKTYRLF